MYILLRNICAPGHRTPYCTVYESESLETIVEKLKQQVLNGCPVHELKIVKEESFEVKCAVKFTKES